MKDLDLIRLKGWFSQHKRKLPWRENCSPYAVWVSEIMLQQTQVAVVIPYFEKWISLFPTVQALARASKEEVIKAWEGLGYYSRARHLHEGAEYLTRVHKGQVPEDESSLRKVKGVGPYTVGAIRSFAFKKKAVAIDANVLRVVSRLFALEDLIQSQKMRQKVAEIVTSLLPDHEPWVIMEGLIELGALVCQKKPKCQDCPLMPCCLSYQTGKTHHIPKLRGKVPVTLLHRLVCIIKTPHYLLLKKGKEGNVMADLFEFPYLEVSEPIDDITTWSDRVEKRFSLALSHQRSLPALSHSFTRYKAFLYPHIFSTSHLPDIPLHQWVPIDEMDKKPFSSGHRRVLAHLLRFLHKKRVLG